MMMKTDRDSRRYLHRQINIQNQGGIQEPKMTSPATTTGRRRRNNRGRRYSSSSGRNSTKLLRVAAAAAMAAAALQSGQGGGGGRALPVVGVTALQPQQPKHINNKLAAAAAARTSTSLDYVPIALPPEKTESENSNKRSIHDLEKLLLLELSMERPVPPEVGVTPAGKSTVGRPPAMKVVRRAASASSTKRITKNPKTKLVSGKKISTKHRRRTTKATAPTSRLLSPAAAATKRSRKRFTGAGISNSSGGKSLPNKKDHGNKKQQSGALLTREEEIELTDRIRALRRAEHIRDEHLHDDTPLTESQWATACGLASQELRKLIKQGQDARSELVQANMGLVTSIAKRQHSSLKHAMEVGNGVGTILTLQDCLQEGQIGLIKAAERFDPSRGVRFGTYATWWIRQRILRSISDSSRTIRLPAHVHNKLTKIRKAKADMQQQIGREPSLPELAHYLEMPVEKLQQYTQSSINVVSLENPLRPTNSGKNDIDRRTIGDTIVSDAPTPFEDAQHKSLKQDVQQVLLEALTADERDVIWARYGLEDGNSKSLEETSRLLGVTRDRVRLVEAKALNKLRSPQKNYRLKIYVGGSLNNTNGGSANANANANAKSSSTKAMKKHMKAKQQVDSPWMTMSHHPMASKEENVVDVTNPFASPIDYASMVEDLDKTLSSSSSKTTSHHHHRRHHHEQNGKSASSSAPAHDRLWFF